MTRLCASETLRYGVPHWPGFLRPDKVLTWLLPLGWGRWPRPQSPDSRCLMEQSSCIGMADGATGGAKERLIIIGTSCSGKTTLTRQLSRTLRAPCIELDAIHWKPAWQPRPTDEFRQMVSEVVAGERWVIDGNYSRVRDIVWARGTTIIWLNYPFRVVLWRALCRTVKRAATQEELFSGNRESFRKSFFSRESIILWVIYSYRRLRAKLPADSGQRRLSSFAGDRAARPCPSGKVNRLNRQSAKP